RVHRVDQVFEQTGLPRPLGSHPLEHRMRQSDNGPYGHRLEKVRFDRVDAHIDPELAP
ncbi:MAG: hypothetical protein QOF16_788, partial [Actinomycetota bacterium]|nr:hypothetical protein [Actinomycetota bacterium]